ncbi:MAG: hypothetical protein IOB84_04060 [Brevundimonas sp.]|nr:hypothetical protein [Brevundimonas sp.]
MIQLLVLAVSLIVAAVVLRVGGRDERLAIALLAALSVLTPLVDGLEADGTRWGVALVDVAAFLGLTAIALGRRRWWPIPLAGCQLVVVLTHAAGLGGDHWTWTAVTVRLIAWAVILLILIFAAYEAYIVRRYGLESFQ